MATMSGLLGLTILLCALCCSLGDQGALRRVRRGTRGWTVSLFDGCRDAEGRSRGRGETWLRWRAERAEYCRCSTRGRERCHSVPVTSCPISRCYNGGTCKEAVYSIDYVCLCPAGFSGDHCEINTSEKCIVGRGVGYRGSWATSKEGTACLNWNSTVLRGKKYTARRVDAGGLGLSEHNYCRNPDNDTMPWCYVFQGIQVVWKYCELPACPSDPFQECAVGAGRTYRGTKAESKFGQRCLPWDSAPVARRMYNAWRPDARELGLGAHNFCRNPDGDLSPWCHVYRGSLLTWEPCDVPKCRRRPSGGTTLGPRGTTISNRATCGQRVERPASGPMYRIRGGQNSDITAQPWQAAITYYSRRSKEQVFRCGGVLIDSCWVLSAAHCFPKDPRDIGPLKVTLGRTFRKENSSSEQIFNVQKYWVHEGFDVETYDNDIAILKLQTDIGICAINSPEVLPVCVPEPSTVLPDWSECEISGYGKERDLRLLLGAGEEGPRASVAPGEVRPGEAGRPRRHGEHAVRRGHTRAGRRLQGGLWGTPGLSEGREHDAFGDHQLGRRLRKEGHPGSVHARHQVHRLDRPQNVRPGRLRAPPSPCSAAELAPPPPHRRKNPTDLIRPRCPAGIEGRRHKAKTLAEGVNLEKTRDPREGARLKHRKVPPSSFFK